MEGLKFVRADVGRPIGEAVETALVRAKHEAVVGARIDGRTAGQQSAGLGGPTVILQGSKLGVDRRSCCAHLIAAHAVGNAAACSISDQVELGRAIESA